MHQLQDFVAQYPDPILQLQRLGGIAGKDYTYQDHLIASIPSSEFFIHCRAMLPLKDIENGVGFGLWVRVSPQDYELYIRALDDDRLYKQFSIVGSLANTWPGFPGTYQDRVRVKTLAQDQRVYITEYLSEPKDILMRRSLLAQADDQETKDHVCNLAMNFLIDLNSRTYLRDFSDQLQQN